MIGRTHTRSTAADATVKILSHRPATRSISASQALIRRLRSRDSSFGDRSPQAGAAVSRRGTAHVRSEDLPGRSYGTGSDVNVGRNDVLAEQAPGLKIPPQRTLLGDGRARRQRVADQFSDNAKTGGTSWRRRRNLITKPRISTSPSTHQHRPERHVFARPPASECASDAGLGAGDRACRIKRAPTISDASIRVLRS